MIIYTNMYRTLEGCCKIFLEEETPYGEYLKLSMYLGYEKDGKLTEIRSLNDPYNIPKDTFHHACINSELIKPIDFVEIFFNNYLNIGIELKPKFNQLVTIVDGVTVVVFQNIDEITTFKEAVFTYYKKYFVRDNSANNRNEAIADKPEQSPVVNENSEIDENINNIIKDCPHMEVPLFKCGTVVLVRDIDTYNKIAGEFKYPEIGPCLGTMETLCSENKRYYVVGIFNDSLTTFVHELTHLAFHIYRDTSMKVNAGEGNETYAYLVDSFFQEWQHLFTNRCD